MPALGVPTEIPRTDRLTRYQFYLGLADALFWRAQPTGGHLEELARAFGYDVLNLAVLAGRLLWCEGVTPEMWRSHDLIAVGVDVETYYVMLQCACDIMADVVATLGAKKNQAPWESFHKLNQWALRNPGRLASEFRIVAAELPWFDKINSQRTAIVHRGEKYHVATDRVSFDGGVSVNEGRILPSLRTLTEAMLDFSEQLGRIVLPEAKRKRFPEKRIIDGVYVPALGHLLSKYRVPRKSPELKLAAQCLLGCGGYVEAAFIGYPDGYWWRVLLTISRALNVAPSAVNIPVNIGGEVEECVFVFSSNGMSCAFIGYDQSELNWLEDITERAMQLQTAYNAERVAIIVRKMGGGAPDDSTDRKIPLIICDDPTEAADTFMKAITKK
jgi:hypothetical protein